MSERLRIAIVAGCLFVVGLHLRTAGHILRDGWRGPYADQDGAAPSMQADGPTSQLEVGSVALEAVRLAREVDDDGFGGARPGM